MVETITYENKTYIIGYDNEHKPCDKCCLRNECINDENDDFLAICEPYMNEGKSCFIEKEIEK